MKKVLFASTALVAFAGAASADIAITGLAEMGIYDTGAVGVGSGAQFFTDIDVRFSMSGETDGGLTFGATVDLDEAAGLAPALANNSDDGGATFFISGGFGTLTMGDTDGALDWAMTEAGMGASMDDSHTEHAGYVGAYLDGAYDNQIVRYDYSFGDFAVAISMEATDGQGPVGVSDGFAIGLRYNLDLGGTTVALGLGYQSIDVLALTNMFAAIPTSAFLTGMFAGSLVGDELDATGLSASASFGGGFTGTLTYTSYDHSRALLDGDHMSIGLGYSMNGLTIAANYGEFDSDTNANDRDGYGLAVNYDLGGGAMVQAGYASGSAGALASEDRWSLGLALSF
jgi:outer membrane protein OmpU